MKAYNHIIQGSNDPIILEIEEQIEFVKISAAWIHDGIVEKTWEHEDVTVQDNRLMLPLEESETKAFSKGTSELDIKALDSNKRVVFFDVIKYIVDERMNKTDMTNK